MVRVGEVGEEGEDKDAGEEEDEEPRYETRVLIQDVA